MERTGGIGIILHSRSLKVRHPHLGDQKQKWENNIKLDCKETGHDSKDCIHLHSGYSPVGGTVM